MSRPNKNDERSNARYLDGQMPAAEREAFVRRLQSEAQLRDAVCAAEEQTGRIRASAEPPMTAPAGFSAAVLDSVRRMPSRGELVRLTDDEESVMSLVGFARQLLLAAILVLGLALLFGFNLLGNVDNEELDAITREQQMQELDKLVIKMKTEELLRRRRN